MPRFYPLLVVAVRTARGWTFYARNRGSPRLHARIYASRSNWLRAALTDFFQFRQASPLNATTLVEGYSGGDAGRLVWDAMTSDTLVRFPVDASLDDVAAQESNALASPTCHRSVSATNQLLQVRQSLGVGEFRRGVIADFDPTSRFATGGNVVSVGVELECVFPSSRGPAIRDAFARCARGQIHDDGSIREGPRQDSAEFLYWAPNVETVSEWLRWAYGTGISTNSSCGFHVHVRPTDERRWVFATRHYWDGFQSAYHQWAASKARKFAARETCDWCSVRPWTRTRVRNALSVGGDRYQAINLASLVRHDAVGTVEHRILPAQSSGAEAVESLEWLVGTTERLLNVERVPVTPAEKQMILECNPLWSGLTFARREAILDNATTLRAPTRARLPWVVGRESDDESLEA